VAGQDDARLQVQYGVQRRHVLAQAAAMVGRDGHGAAIHRDISTNQDAFVHVEQARMIGRVSRRGDHPHLRVANGEHRLLLHHLPGDRIGNRQRRALAEDRLRPARVDTRRTVDVIRMAVRDDHLPERTVAGCRERIGDLVQERGRRRRRVDERGHGTVYEVRVHGALGEW